MPNGVQIDARRDFVRRVLPWLIAAAMLVFYVLTLNHWVSQINLAGVVRISGWAWAPDYNSPLYCLVTTPFRLLPVSAVPLALNLFSAVCATLVLGLLARSVGLLPHDRTEAQQVRERNDFFLLTLRSAWLPSLLAVLLCGLQLTFWETATNGGSEMFDLLLFGFVIWSLVEYRLDGRVWRLYASAVVVGLGVVEGPAVTAFFPLFIVAIIWVRGMAFFNVQFLIRIFLWGLAGFLFLLIYRLVSVLGLDYPTSFGQTLRLGLRPQMEVLRLVWGCISSPGQYLSDLLMPIFISLMPLLVMSVRWKFGDNSKIGSSLASVMFHAIHAIFLGVCIWIAFDPPFSPREKGLGLTLNYLVALGAGYYAGYFLLVFGRTRPRLKETPPALVRLGNMAVVICVWGVAALAIAGLIYKNNPLVREANSGTLRKFTSLVVRNLPPRAIVLSDNPERMFLTKAALASDGRTGNYLLLNTAWLPYPEYHRFLNKQSPQMWPLMVKPAQTNLLSPLALVELLTYLHRTNNIYYLHPSVGYYFEEFYLEPHGLVYKLKTLPRDTLLPPPPDKNLIAENKSFWKDAQAELAPVTDALAPADPSAPENFVDAQLAGLHVPHEQDFNAVLAGAYCSASLDFWGVELQRIGDLTDAAARFTRALEFNTNNVAAQLNLEVNQALAAGNRVSADPADAAFNQFGTFDSVARVLSIDGPIDDPAFCFQYGWTLAQVNKFFRQAVAPLKRAYQLDPDYLLGRIWLARVYGMNRMPDQMFDVLRAPLRHTDESSTSQAQQLNMLLSAAYFQKNDLTNGVRLLESEVSRDPTNQNLLSTVGQIYINRGMYSNALAIANMQSRLLPNDSSMLLTKAYLYSQLKQYEKAITTVKRVLDVQKENPSALFILANSYFGAGNLDAARTNYEKLQQMQTNSPQVAYGLEEIAWRQHDTNEAIRNIDIYLGTQTNTPEAKLMAGRLQQLKQ